MTENKFLIREFRADSSLAGPGMAASFKVVLKNGNEAVTIERPA